MRRGRSTLVALVLLAGAAAAPLAARSEDGTKGRLAQAREALRAGEPDRAVALLETIPRRLRNDADYRTTDALARMRTGDFDAADLDVRWLETNAWQDPEVHVLRGRLELARSDRLRLLGAQDEARWRAGKAAKAVAKISAETPARPGALEVQAEALAKSGATDGAIAAYRALIAADSARAESFEAAARAAAGFGRWDEVAALDALAGGATDKRWAVLRGAIAGGDDRSILRMISELDARSIEPSRKAALDAYRGLIERPDATTGFDWGLEPEGLDAADRKAFSEACLRRTLLPATGGGSAASTRKPPAGLTLPVLETKVEPTYPAELRRARKSGWVVLVARVSKEGRVGLVGVVRSPDIAFSRAAADAVERWRYRPATIDGRPVAITFTIRVDFNVR